jgi:membrane protease YdiL (CAAX protease family)
MKSFAVNNPIAFAILTTIVLYILLVGSFIIGRLLSDLPNGNSIGDLAGKVLISILFIFIIYNFNWQKGSGINNAGSFKSWIIVLIPVVYAILATVYAYTGSIDNLMPQSVESIWTAFNMFTYGLVEEIVFRGLIFYCFILAWQDRKAGVMNSVLVSSIIFGFGHMLWVLMGKEFELGLLQSLGALISGIFYAALVIQTKSIWPAVIVHGLTNALVYTSISNLPDFQETVHSGLLDLLFSIPILIYSLIIITKNSKYPK